MPRQRKRSRTIGRRSALGAVSALGTGALAGCLGDDDDDPADDADDGDDGDDAGPDDWVEYDTRAMTDRLGVTVVDDAYQDLVDQLAWVANQTVPKALSVGQTRLNPMNDHRWHVQGLEDRPESWIRLPFRHIWHNGVLSYVPEAER